MKGHYSQHLDHADDVIEHLRDAVIPSVNDPELEQKYAGFASVVAVTAYELSIKSIFIKFAHEENQAFGDFVEESFSKINGRIALGDIKGFHIQKFGEKYKNQFKEETEKKFAEYRETSDGDIKTSYDNLIEWRNHFVHNGQIPSMVSYNDVVDAYKNGKEVIHCLGKTMTR